MAKNVNFDIPVGTEVSWSSQGSGSVKTKTGIVRAHLSSLHDMDGVSFFSKYACADNVARDLKEVFPLAYFRSLRPNHDRRYLVEVTTKHKRTGEPLKSRWYTPHVNVVNSQNPLAHG
jgi:hypothetical protein